MALTQYVIRERNAKIVTREPTAGKWYAGADSSEDGTVYGELARYEGGDNWTSDTDSELEPDMRVYEWLVEQA